MSLQAGSALPARGPYLKVEEVCELLGCSKRTIHERARLGEIPHRRPPGARRLLFLMDELREWLDGAALECVDLPHAGRVVRPNANETRGRNAGLVKNADGGGGHVQAYNGS
jgi:excisionase family DNA binding protein